MKAIGKNIIITKIVEKETTEGGLILSSSDRKDIRYKKAKVISAGTDVAGIKDGDEIMYDGSSGYSLMLNGVSYSVIYERDVAIVLS